MRKIKLYIAVSLDGKIAKPDGGTCVGRMNCPILIIQTMGTLIF
jgi:hypothetical protein